MPLSKGQLVVLDVLIRNIELLAQLYGLYAMKLPHKYKFWYGAAMEKKGHADLLRTTLVVDSTTMFFDENRFNVEEMQASLELARKRLLEVESKALYPFVAVNNALEIEQRLFERRFFENRDGDGEDVRTVMNLITEQLTGFVGRLKNEYAALEQAEDQEP
jgi:hypothetical protein